MTSVRDLPAMGSALTGVSRRGCLVSLVAPAAWLVAPAQARAGGQLEEPLMDSVRTALTSAVGNFALAMYLLGVPNPVLWGVMVCALNFIPYIGDIISFSVLTVVGLLTFDQLWQSLMVPGIFYLLTAIEGYLITPIIVSRRLSLNPVVIILSVLFWGWMWGVAGALLAVPILVAMKTVCDRVDSLNVVGEYLGE